MSTSGRIVIVTGVGCRSASIEYCGGKTAWTIVHEGQTFKLNIGGAVAFLAAEEYDTVIGVVRDRVKKEILSAAAVSKGLTNLELVCSDLATEEASDAIVQLIPVDANEVSLVHCVGDGRWLCVIPGGKVWRPYDDAVIDRTQAHEPLRLQARSCLAIIKAMSKRLGSIKFRIVLASPVYGIGEAIRSKASALVSTWDESGSVASELAIEGIVDSGVADSENVLQSINRIPHIFSHAGIYTKENAPLLSVRDVAEKALNLLHEDNQDNTINHEEGKMRLARFQSLIDPNTICNSNPKY